MANKLIKNPNEPVTSFDMYDETVWDLVEDISQGVAPIIEEAAYTDDFPFLARKSHHYLFTYGTLKKGFRLASCLDDAELVSFGYTINDNFWMIKTKGAPNYPIVLIDNRPDYKARVFGEIYKVSAETIRELDYLESNRIMYKRMYLPCRVVTDVTGKTEDIRCWIYVGIRDYWNSRSSRLEPINRCRPKAAPNHPYYCFTKKDQTLVNQKV